MGVRVPHLLPNLKEKMRNQRLIQTPPLFKTRRWGSLDVIGDYDALVKVVHRDLDPENRHKTVSGRVIDDYELVVATDSQVIGRKTCFVTGVVVKPIGTGAWGYYWKSFFSKGHRPENTEERLWEEVELTCQIATPLIHIEDTFPNVELWAELDFNGVKKTRSNRLLSAAVSYLNGYGLRVRAKPVAWCATFYTGRIANRAR